MMDIDSGATIALALAAAPALIGLLNLLLLRPPQGRVPDRARVSVLIDATDDAAEAEAAIAHALGQIGVAVEVIVLAEPTPALVALAAREPRLRLLADARADAPAQRRAALAGAATGTHLLVLDAGVRLHPHAAAALAGQAARMGAGLVSGLPRQRIRGLAAFTAPLAALLPLAYRPGAGRALTRLPLLAAASDRLFLVTRAAWDAAGGGTAPDAPALARRLRAAGIATDMVDAADLAVATPRDARLDLSPVALPLWTVLLAGGHLLPLLLLPAGRAMQALGLVLALRLAVTLRAREPWWTVPLHPVTVAVALAGAWWRLGRTILARQPRWTARAAPGGAGP